LLAEKIYKIQKELEEKRAQRMKEHSVGGVTVESLSSASTSVVSTVLTSTGSLTGSPCPAQSPSLEYAENLIQSGQ